MTNKGRQEERPSGHRRMGQKVSTRNVSAEVGAFIDLSPDEKNGTNDAIYLGSRRVSGIAQPDPITHAHTRTWPYEKTLVQHNTAPSLGSEMKSFTRTPTGFYGCSEDELLHRFSFTCDTLPTRRAEFEEAVFQNTCSLYAFRTLAAYSARFACFRFWR
ncbi:hypothetical protein GE21DRAFT_9022 [Neurospora crassa]|uniref:Uncharacterized protein n=1 Tax=Neurospora crassa (strain ATCC 24698 / 74-OR23-1A / CBS 708.71 / DSM 1257 / FGSC 987) TaxID=367110 RepID=Q7S6T2_NEUCR|nr:hypothetical protein NCU05507 [Neurospora crassa OR74A]EAA31233.2 hypothetical protein NCU05507 [Neurospora crassa OR74A]KHE81651.1 hypothetical protein GE21DRAFT_9022 [Neurospora crassa]|eukprot:XP_960469.2 hypothetical protein NCU05507 [Neurospora crassa OR74A]